MKKPSRSLFTLSEVADHWSRLTRETFTVNDLIDYAAHTKALDVVTADAANAQRIHIRSLNLCFYVHQHKLDAATAEILHANEYSGVLYAPPAWVREICQNGSVMVKRSVENVSERMIRFASEIKLTRQDLRVSSEEAERFQKLFMGKSTDAEKILALEKSLETKCFEIDNLMVQIKELRAQIETLQSEQLPIYLQPDNDFYAPELDAAIRTHAVAVEEARMLDKATKYGVKKYPDCVRKVLPDAIDATILRISALISWADTVDKQKIALTLKTQPK